MNHRTRTLTAAIPYLAAVLGALAGCDEPETLPPLGHHVVTIDTDAIVPPSPVAPQDPDAPVPLFDRLELSILRAGESEPAPGATRDFSVNNDTFAPSGATFTIESEEGERVRVRARLYRASAAYAGKPRPETTIEVFAALPETPAEGAVYTTIELRTEDVGVPRGNAEEPLVESDETASLVHAGGGGPTRVGSWPGARHVPCGAPADAEEACVPGGAYWMGNPLVKGDDFVESDRQRLVVLSPFFLDTREVKVGELREWLATQPPEMDTVPRRSADPNNEAHFCTYTDAASATSEERPANCVSWELAQAFCEDRGASLPSEAQFEYASSELRSALFVWGADEAPLCEAAVWGRGGVAGSVIEGVGNDDCLSIGGDNGPQTLPLELAARDATRLTDRIDIGGATVFDLAGNLQEWVVDRYNKQDEPCWSRADTNIFVNPVCSTPGTLGGHSVRGGSWVQDRAFLRAAYRTNREPLQSQAYVVGFRCARTGE